MTHLELIDGAAVAGTEDGRPPCFGRWDWMLARFGAGFALFDADFPEKRNKSIRFTDAIPRVESFVEIGSHFANGIPKGGGRRFEKARAPGSDRKLTTRPDELPKCPHGGGHVWNKENTKDADDRIEV